MRIFALLCFSLLSFAALTQPASAIENPSNFIARIYATYGHDDVATAFIGETGPKRIASKQFLAVLEEDQALTLPGDIGYLDADPICQCQDYQNLVVTDINILSNDNKKSHAAVTFRAFSDNSLTTTTTFDLVAENEQWFIDDIFDANQHSVRNAIDANNKALRIKGETLP
ncbi:MULTISPECIES: DUF3828 domain-containing protein [unclassified Serratia (in: enterobacteria)]|uniref:DUF3828 domain-containing protein n=1 Tax=unclassified Serratia (in: enterobacteria) TaxID=2647522 RepID=UPI001CBE52FE|nr:MULTISPECIES: DUF3828 domain-containing protein [unclassified Serratia (in: enterobacteria)]UAN56433.1 DUF3828 domain-containing protein [Serratia sp. JSRIV004]UAN62044.1 DUF3828 domain-containing protein [Serratia sp. JSRIV006]